MGAFVFICAVIICGMIVAISEWRDERKDTKMKRLLYVIYTALMFGWIVGCHRSSNRTENLEDSTVYDVGDTSFSDSVWKDSFTVTYRQPVNGYKVKAVVKFEQGCYFYPTEDGMLVADITFEKNGHSFIVHTDSYGDTCFSAGMRGFEDGRNIAILRKYHGKNINADFPALTSSSTPLPMDVPFFFKDFDFDGKDELIVVHYGCAVKNHDEYDIYRIVDGNPMLLDSPPFRYKEDNNKSFRMTDYPEFDYKSKTITCPYPEGDMQYDGRIVYGVSKNVDKKVLKGKTYRFNRIERQKEYKYIWREHGDLAGEIEYKYINGKKLMTQHDFNLDSIFINARQWYYINERFGFLVEYPSFMECLEADNGDGATFSFLDICYRVWGGLNLTNEALSDVCTPKERSYYTPQSYLRKKYPNVREKKMGKDFYSVAIEKNGHGYFEKGILYNDKDTGTWLRLSLDYPISKKKMVKPLLDYIDNYREKRSIGWYN